MPRRNFTVGDHAPWFSCRASNNDDFNFDTIGGHYLILGFIGSAGHTPNKAIIDFITQELRPLLDDSKVAFFGISMNPEDESTGRLKQSIPGIRYFWDYDGKVSALYGAIEAAVPGEPQPRVDYTAFTLVLDPNMRVIANISCADPAEHNRILKQLIERLPSLDDYAQTTLHAPVLIMPRLFEPSFCKRLIDLYEQSGGTESGFMRDVGGNTVGVMDHSFKRRRDYMVKEEDVRAAIRQRIDRRLVPELKKAFQYQANVVERYLIACYDANEGGYFNAHRDNTTKGTAHRRFAVTINLNAGEYEGGDLRFPEFGQRTYRAPTGGAVVFSCTLLHEATPVTRGRRYAMLPFLYDTQAAKIREENLRYLSGDTVHLHQNKPIETPTA